MFYRCANWSQKEWAFVLGHTVRDSRVKTKTRPPASQFRALPMVPQGFLSKCLLLSHNACWEPSLRTFIFIETFHVLSTSWPSSWAPEAVGLPEGLQGVSPLVFSPLITWLGAQTLKAQGPALLSCKLCFYLSWPALQPLVSGLLSSLCHLCSLLSVFIGSKLGSSVFIQ